MLNFLGRPLPHFPPISSHQVGQIPITICAMPFPGFSLVFPGLSPAFPGFALAFPGFASVFAWFFLSSLSGFALASHVVLALATLECGWVGWWVVTSARAPKRYGTCRGVERLQSMVLYKCWASILR